MQTEPDDDLGGETTGGNAAPDVRRSFRDLSDPFSSRNKPDAARIIKQTFEAVEVWGRDHRVVRADRETPQEFLQRMTQHYPEQKERLQHLAQLYNRLAYSGGQAQQEEVKPLRDLWSWLSKTAVCLMLTTILPFSTSIADDGEAARLSFAIRSFDTATNRRRRRSATLISRAVGPAWRYRFDKSSARWNRNRRPVYKRLIFTPTFVVGNGWVMLHIRNSVSCRRAARHRSSSIYNNGCLGLCRRSVGPPVTLPYKHLIFESAHKGRGSLRWKSRNYASKHTRCGSSSSLLLGPVPSR